MLFLTFKPPIFILVGIGEACSVISIWMALNSYFDKRHGLAMGLKAFGSSIGMFAGPPFARFLIDKYAWRGALMLLAGCQIQVYSWSFLLSFAFQF